LIEYVPSKHAKERWVERVNSEAGVDVEQQIINALNEAEFIWEDSEGKHYYIDKNLIEYVCNPVNHKIITIFYVDYGFPDDINKTIANDLLDKVRQKRDVIEVMDIQQTKQRERNSVMRSKYQMQIDELDAKIKALEAKENELNAVETRMDADMVGEKKEYDRLAYQLICSLNYKMDKLATGGAA
jgi:hypothetical protein